MPHNTEERKVRHSEDIQDIITIPPRWLLRWGVTVFFIFVILIIAMSSVIEYPDIVKTHLTVTSIDAPKSVVAKTQSRLTQLLVKDDQFILHDQPLAYLESTAKHEDVLQLIKQLNVLQQQALNGKIIGSAFIRENNYTLGELQTAYQVFSEKFLSYQAAVNNGIWARKKTFLKADLINLRKQEIHLINQKKIQTQDYLLSKEEYEVNKKLFNGKFVSLMELRQAESKFLSKQLPLLQTDASLIIATSSYSAKQKEIVELDNQMEEERSKFFQALNSLISEANDWRNKYVLTASQDGKLAFAGVIQQNQVINAGQEVFYINPKRSSYYGEMPIPQDNMGKVKTNQRVLVKLRSYPFQEFGIIVGRIKSVNDVPYKDSIFFSRVTLDVENENYKKVALNLKQGMLADAEIITQEATILDRILRNMTKIINMN